MVGVSPPDKNQSRALNSKLITFIKLINCDIYFRKLLWEFELEIEWAIEEYQYTQKNYVKLYDRYLSRYSFAKHSQKNNHGVGTYLDSFFLNFDKHDIFSQHEK